MMLSQVYTCTTFRIQEISVRIQEISVRIQEISKNLSKSTYICAVRIRG
jgi:hypothetical protein